MIKQTLKDVGFGLKDFFTSHRELIVQLTKRDVLERYKGSFLGLAWSFLYPLLMLLVYYFVFGIVFQMRWSGTEGGNPIEGKVAFGTIMFAGLILHGFFSEVFTRSPNIIIHNVHYVKKIVFPLEVFSIVTVLTASFHFAVGVFILLSFHLVTGGSISWHLLLMPLVLIPFVLLLLGMAWFLSSFTIFLRDTAQITGVFSTILLFLSPIFYPLDVVPLPFRYLMYLNPLTIPVNELRSILIWNELPNFLNLGIYSLVAMLVYVLGSKFFYATRKMFADVL